MFKAKYFIILILLVDISTQSENANIENQDEFKRSCKDMSMANLNEEQKENRLQLLQNQLKTINLNAYVITSYDDHLAELKYLSKSPLMYVSGLTIRAGEAAVTQNSAALWIDSKFLKIADRELSCDWKIFDNSKNTTIGMWLQQELPHDNSTIGVDPSTIPHEDWENLSNELKGHNLKATKIIFNFPSPNADYFILFHNSSFTGALWQDKMKILRDRLAVYQCNAIVVSSLSEIAYLLNIRSSDFKYEPVFRAYLIVTLDEAILYTNKAKISLGVQQIFNFELKNNKCSSFNCVMIKNYEEFLIDLSKLRRNWQTVLLPSKNSFDMGTSEEIYSWLGQATIISKTSPIAFMRSQKNEIESENVRFANLRHSVAACESMRIFEGKIVDKKFASNLTEHFFNSLLIESSLNQSSFKGFAFDPSVAFAENTADQLYFPPENSSSQFNKKEILTIDFGSQYLEGTTSLARTIHYGKPSKEQKRIYTIMLSGIIQLGLLVFPENMRISGIEILTKGPMWRRKQEYQFEGTGIGAFLGVEESPINIAQPSDENISFKDGNFFTVSPSLYKEGEYGIKLRNVFEVVDTGKVNFAGARFLKFRLATLVPFDLRLIELGLLTTEERTWLNGYNADIREILGDELKKQNKMDTFYWMMNQTEHILQIVTEDEYIESKSSCFEVEILLFILSIFLSIFTNAIVDV